MPAGLLKNLNSRPRQLNSRRGVTLVELLLVIGISVGVFVFVGFTANQFSRVSSFVNSDLLNKQGISQVFQTMVSEIRSAGPSSAGDYAIQSASPTDFTFFSDVDGDGLFERVRYFLTTSTLERGLIKPTGTPLAYSSSSETKRILIEGILPASSSFYYYDSSYTGAEPPLSYPIDVSVIRLVEVNIAADLNPDFSSQPVFWSEMVTIRNLRLN